MKIGFDLDGVIIDHGALKLELAKANGFSLMLEHTSSEIMKTMLPSDKYLAIQLSIYNDPDNPSPLMVGVLDILELLQKKEIPFFLISRRKNVPVINKWFQDRGLSKYFISENSFFVATKEEKDKVAKKLGITHYIDDEVSVLEKLVSVNHKFLFDQFGVFPKSDLYTKIS